MAKKKTPALVATGTPGMLLTYYTPTQPSPLQASPPSAPVNAFLNVVASAAGQSIYCKEIDIYVPVGTGDGYLTANKPLVTPNTPLWTATLQAQADKTRLPKELQMLNTNWVQITCLAVSPSSYLINYDLQFSINIQGVDSTVGQYPLGLVEFVNTDGSTNFTQNSAQITLYKTSPDFYLNNFIASSSGGTADPNVPVGAFKNGEAFILSWQSNGTNYNVYTAETLAPIYSGPSTNFTVAAGIAKDTTFIVQAEVVGGPESGGTNPSFESIFLYAAITVNCLNADLTPNSINAATTITAQGNLVGQSNLNVTGLTTTGSLTSNGATTLNGATSLNGITTVNGTLNGTQGATLSSLTVNGTTSLPGGLNINAGKVSIFNGPTNLYSGTAQFTQTYTASTDGMLVGYVDNPSTWTQICIYWIFGISDSMKMGATGGNTLVQLTYPISNPASFTLPIKAGENFTIYVTPWNQNQITANVTFNFFPLGNPAQNFEVTLVHNTPHNHILRPRPGAGETDPTEDTTHVKGDKKKKERT